MIGELTGLTGLGPIYFPTIWGNATSGACDTEPAPKTLGDQNGKWHFDGTNIAFVDGHAKWMKYEQLGDSDGNGVIDNGLYDLN